MLRSMTGYGRSSRTIGENHHEAELRSLNSKQLNLKVQLPPRFQDQEIQVRNFLSERIPRGKVDLSVKEKGENTEKLYQINKEVLRAHYRELESLAEELGDDRSEILSAALQIPDSLSYSSQKASSSELEELWKLLEDAFQAFEEFTEQEGGHLRKDLEAQIHAIKEGLDQIEPYEDERRQKVHERLRKKMKETLDQEEVDEKRFEQELLHYLDRLDINEEKTRLRSHLQQFHQVMNEEGSGKKLNFISQEIGREINTIGAKADHAPTQQIVVDMKDHLERIKEQVMNVR